jgi:hypothetical protein
MAEHEDLWRSRQEAASSTNSNSSNNDNSNSNNSGWRLQMDDAYRQALLRAHSALAAQR